MKLKLILLVGSIVLVIICVYYFKLTSFNSSDNLLAKKNSQPTPAVSKVDGRTGKAPAVTISPQSAPLSVTIAKLTLPLTFSDTATSSELRQAVARDLQMVYGHLDGYDILSAGSASPVIVNGHAVSPTKLINFTGSGRFFPEALDAEIGYVGIIDGRDTLLINDKVVMAYRKALDRCALQPEAFREIDHFVNELNLMENGKPLPRAEQLYVIDPAVSSQFDQINKDDFTQQFVGLKFRAPSLLEIVDGSEIDEGYKGKLVGKLYIIAENGLKEGMPPIIFDLNRWKLLILSPP